MSTASLGVPLRSIAYEFIDTPNESLQNGLQPLKAHLHEATVTATATKLLLVWILSLTSMQPIMR